jgi:hypothetical protein
MDGALPTQGVREKFFRGLNWGSRGTLFKSLGALNWILCQFSGEKAYKRMWCARTGKMGEGLRLMDGMELVNGEAVLPVSRRGNR